MIMLIDARNIMYRAVHANRANRERDKLAGAGKSIKSSFIIMIRQISSWIREYEPISVQIFWDAPRSTVWRRELLEGYKAREQSQHTEDAANDLITTENIATAMFEWLNVRQFKKDRMEADDLIYAACRVQCTSALLICSSDGDMQQLLYSVPRARIYNPDTRKIITESEFNPVWFKALVGDTSDKIPGYDGIGPKTAAKILTDPGGIATLLESRGKERFVLNLKLIDLGLSPYILQNQLYISKAMAVKPKFDKTKILELCSQYKIGMTDLIELLAPFRRLT